MKKILSLKKKYDFKNILNPDSKIFIIKQIKNNYPKTQEVLLEIRKEYNFK